MNIKMGETLATSLFFAFLNANGMESIKFNNRANRDIFSAAENGDIFRIQELLNNGANVDFFQTYEPYIYTPLYYAISNSRLGAVKCLVYNGADLYIELTQYKYNAIELASKESQDNNNRRTKYPSLYRDRGDAPDEILKFLEKHAMRMQKNQVENLKYATNKVNMILAKTRRDNINSAVVLPVVLENLILSYWESYPESSEEFYELSDDVIDEMIRIYSDSFEKSRCCR